ncbi:rhodanese-like domain-containing protein [Parasedimentitalea huanghaiensis]|uniref:Rhodanese-like domain-containing protein n=1 Tax=Parasedimentitalea huanghaiensis TaxID=2682100 RepID=A0A6L6WH60_9RHOB|nr:rhodanese-like domain-containing protein [Zongyanglinia huanghaiensis]MVO17146.1 rhodanese-like domain-containing protein [Zongyanglinia huanghaiensis]
MMRIFHALAVVGVAVTCAGATLAETVGITKTIIEVTVQTSDGPVGISRVQDTENRVDENWARTSRACPPFCVQPMVPAEGVTAIGELELMDMLVDPEAMVVDSRVVANFAGGSIPGAVNIPFAEASDRLDELGCEIDFDGFDCQAAKPVALFCNGPWCGQSPTAARNMIAAGYPADKIFYYRGGMQNWRMLGLTVTD